MSYPFSLFFALYSQSVAPAVVQDSISLHLVPSGTFQRVGGYRPYGLKLSGTAAAGWSPPTGSAGTFRFGAFEFGAGKDARRYCVAVEEPVSATSHVWLDEEGRGDLSKCVMAAWASHPYKKPTGVSGLYFDTALTINLALGDRSVPCKIGVYPTQDGQDLSYYADFCLSGKLVLAGIDYDAIYWDSLAKWDPKESPCTLMVDTDHDGKFHPAYEFFSSERPFNIKGVTYELTRAEGKDGIDALSIVRSKKFVKERTLADLPKDPNLANGLRVGGVAPAFQAVTMSGAGVHFPGGYAGKVVMLDFWATWCGPCMREAPNVAKIYAKYHGAGLEILGVSLDQPNSASLIRDTTKHVGMTWSQVYDGKAWKGGLVTKYGIQSIPATYLVDGSTGKVLAMLDELRGAELEKSVQKALARRPSKTSP